MRAMIVLEVENRPRVVFDCLSEAEECRLGDWLRAKGYTELIDRALELATEEPAA